MQSQLEYFTLEEDSEVEEYVAEDPNYKRKVFWFDLVGKAIDVNSRLELGIQAIVAGISFVLEWNLFLYYFRRGDLGGLGWTVALAIALGAGNVLLQIFHVNASEKRVGKLVHEEVDIRYYQHLQRFASSLIRKIALVRYIFAFLLISPLLNLFYCWNEIGKSTKDLRRPLILRSAPQPSLAEIQLVETNLEKALGRIYLTLLEAACKFIPFALAQVFIYIRMDERVEVGLGDYGIRGYTILWHMITLSWICVTYSLVYQNYTRALQFRDLREFGISMNLSLSGSGIVPTLVQWIDNLVSVVFRMYCLTILMSTLHFLTILIFIPVVYVSFHLVMSTMPARSRLRFENAQLPDHQRGLTSKVSDLLSRWVNIFCSYNLKYECHLHFTFLFTFFYAMARVGWLVSAWTDIGVAEMYNGTETTSTFQTSSPIYSTDMFQNETDIFQNSTFVFRNSSSSTLAVENSTATAIFPNITATAIMETATTTAIMENSTSIFEYAANCQAASLPPIPAPLLDTLTSMTFQLLTMVTGHCSPSRNLLQTDFGVAILFLIHFLLGLLQLAKSKSALFGTDFPAQIGYKWWAVWFSKELDMIDTFEMRKIILCMILPDAEIQNLARHYRNWSAICFGSTLHGNRQALQVQMDKYWEVCGDNARVGILSPSVGRLEQLIERRKVVRNASEADINLNKFLTFVMDHYELDDETLLVIIYAVMNFDLMVQQSSSLRLSHINLILK